MNEIDAERRRNTEYPLLAELDGEAILLSLATGEYFALNETGIAIWRQAMAGRGLSEIVSVLVQEHGAAPETALRDAEEFLQELVANGLICPHAE